MTSHPNRGHRRINPTPEQIKALRERCGLTQTEAGAKLFTSCRVWQQWEAGDRRMHGAFWMLFRILVGDLKL